MIKENVYVTIELSSKKCFVFWDGSNWQTTSNIFLADRIALLQYIPAEIPVNIIAEIYERGEYLIEYEPEPVTYDYIESKVDFVDIHITKDDGLNWLKVKEKDVAIGNSDFEFTSNDFSVGDVIKIKVEKHNKPTIFGISNVATLEILPEEE